MVRSSLLVQFAVLLGCYEIPPELADRSAASQPAGWPPLAVYHEDPFHPANLLFQRLFFVDGPVEDAAGAGDMPVCPRGPFEALDRAELVTYAERIICILSDSEQPTDALSPRGKAMLVRDATVERDRLNDRGAPGDDEVAATLDRLARTVTRSASQPLPALPPRPTVH